MITKTELRARARATRPPRNPAYDNAIAHFILTQIPLRPTIAGIWPLPAEPDLRPLFHTLHARGHRIVLPQTPPLGAPLIFRLWTPISLMIPERFGTCHPDGPIAEPDMLLVPLLAFDRAGHRLGYGGGYYDRTLAALPGRPAIGIAYAAQELPQIPPDPHDHPLQTIVTEKEIIQLTP